MIVDSVYHCIATATEPITGEHLCTLPVPLISLLTNPPDRYIPLNDCQKIEDSEMV